MSEAYISEVLVELVNRIAKFDHLDLFKLMIVDQLFVSLAHAVRHKIKSHNARNQ